MKASRIFCIGLWMSGFLSHAQVGLERIYVEKFYQVNEKDASIPLKTGEIAVGSVAYRIYLDLLPGYRFQVAYGTPQHPITIKSSAPFYNHVEVGNSHPNVIPERTLSKNISLLDTWLSTGAAAENHIGVPLYLDATKDSFPISWNKEFLQSKLGDEWNINERDGMLRSSSLNFPNFYNLDEQKKLIHADTRTSEIKIENGAWAALGKGSIGYDSLGTNMILIGQFTTPGNLEYALNIMVRDPNGKSIRYVYDQPGEGEILLPLLKGEVNYCSDSSPKRKSKRFKRKNK